MLKELVKTMVIKKVKMIVEIETDYELADIIYKNFVNKLVEEGVKVTQAYFTTDEVKPMLTKTRIKPESMPVIEIRIDKNQDLIKEFALVLVLGKNEIIIKRSEHLPEVEKVQRQFQRDSKVMWVEILRVGESNGKR